MDHIGKSSPSPDGWIVEPADVGAWVRAGREAQGVDQAALAGRIGVGRMTVSRLERGEPVALPTVISALHEVGLQLTVVPADRGPLTAPPTKETS